MTTKGREARAVAIAIWTGGAFVLAVMLWAIVSFLQTEGMWFEG